MFNQNIPKAINAAITNISPIARGRFESNAKTLFGAVLRKPHGGTPPNPSFPSRIPSFPAMPRLSSAAGGAAASKKTISFFFVALQGASPPLLPSEVLSFDAMRWRPLERLRRGIRSPERRTEEGDLRLGRRRG